MCSEGLGSFIQQTDHRLGGGRVYIKVLWIQRLPQYLPHGKTVVVAAAAIIVGIKVNKADTGPVLEVTSQVEKVVVSQIYLSMYFKL